MTREELHAQVWSQPMRMLAKTMGISDVALAKRCRVADVPVPPRAWRNRKEAGKPVKVEPLPPPSFVMANYFPATDHRANGGGNACFATASPDGTIRGPPIFRDLGSVGDEI